MFPVVQSGLTYKVSLSQMASLAFSTSATNVATTTALTVIYNNGTLGVGATLTNNGALAALSIDGVSLNVNDKVLVKDQATSTQNGIYTVTTVGDGSTAWVMTRAISYDLGALINPGDVFTVTQGTVNENTQWIQTEDVSTVGSDNILFVSNIIAGSGLVKTNNSIALSSSYSPFSYQVITGTSQSAVANTSYIIGNAGATTITIPATVSVGSVFGVVGKGAAGWIIQMNTGQVCNLGTNPTTAGGTLTSTDPTDCLEMVCITANTTFTVRSYVGSITPA
jgi:hypothetical protein